MGAGALVRSNLLGDLGHHSKKAFKAAENSARSSSEKGLHRDSATGMETAGRRSPALVSVGGPVGGSQAPSCWWLPSARRAGRTPTDEAPAGRPDLT